MTSTKKTLSAALLVLAAFMANKANAMIRHVFISEPPVSNEQFDAWYAAVHSQECLRYFGPWLKRYEAYNAHVMPPDARRPDAYKGRYMELWYDNVEAWKEAAPLAHTYSSPPWGPMNSPQKPSASLIVPAVPTDNFLGKPEPPPSGGPYFRFLFAMKYPEGVSVEDGEKWYLTYHSQEAKLFPGLLRYVSYRVVPNSPVKSGWVRLGEMWYKDYDSWKKALANPKYTAPPWAAQGKPWLDVVQIFTSTKPDFDYLKMPGRP
jgi:hypothetical protein